jgi:hypothetical protein
MCLATRCLAMGMVLTTQKTIFAIRFLLVRVRISVVAYKWVYVSHYNSRRFFCEMPQNEAFMHSPVIYVLRALWQYKKEN